MSLLKVDHSPTFSSFIFREWNKGMVKMTKRKIWTYQQIKHFIEEENCCTLLTDEENFINTKTKLDIVCTCGNSFKCSFKQFKSQNKRNCNECTKKRLSEKFKNNTENILNYINNEDTGNGCTYLKGEYVNNRSPLTILCSCGNIFVTDYATFRHSNKKQCNECGFKRKGQSKKVNYDEVVSLMTQHGCELITPMTGYKNATQSLDIKCSCGNIFQNTYSLFKYGKIRRCNECYRKELSERNKIPYSKIKKFIEIETNSGCKLLTTEEEYVNSRANVDFQCTCGQVFTTSFHEFKSGNKRQCNECGNNLMKTIDFLDLFKDSQKENNCVLISYEDNDGYIGTRSKIILKCKCGETFTTKRYQFMSGKNKCDKCSSALTKGEEVVKNTLNKLNINNAYQFYFNDCRGVRRPLPFDFAVFDSNEILICLIEYDGKQHFEPVNFGGISNEEALAEHENIKSNDQIKNQYCIENKIPLIRIPYWEFDNIEEILKYKLDDLLIK